MELILKLDDAYGPVITRAKAELGDAIIHELVVNWLNSQRQQHDMEDLVAAKEKYEVLSPEDRVQALSYIESLIAKTVTA